VTNDPEVAAGWLGRFQGAGIDGVMAKDERLPYEPGVRSLLKVKRERTADCVVAGFRWLGDRPLPSSLLLGLYDEDGALEHVGVVSSFAERERGSLLERLAPLVVPLAGHPWERGFLLSGGPVGRLVGSAGRWTPDMAQDWVPVAPALVCEVAHGQLDGFRFRHPARLRRWRPDREAASCRLDQLAVAAPDLDGVLAPA
jgi:ATP-dependent DNA ligase